MTKPNVVPLAVAAAFGAGLAICSKYVLKLHKKKALRVLITGAAGELSRRATANVTLGLSLLALLGSG